jgi:histidinol dehydrogenase
MKTYFNPEKETWPEILKRPLLEVSELHNLVGSILNTIRLNGEEALHDLTLQYDGADIVNWEVTGEEFENAEKQTDDRLKEAIKQAAVNIHNFHKPQLHPVSKMETMPGVWCWQKTVPIEKVGLYIPGGSAPLFSTVLMLAVPAQLAGCREIILCTPPAKDGSVHPAILYAARLAGVTRVFKLGGVQAIGAMAYGVVTPKVDKIFGPGNQYIMAAKQLVSFREVAIDMPAGPSEVAILADRTSHPGFIAADLLSQAEHGPDSQVLLVLKGNSLLEKIREELERQLSELPRRDIARKALDNSRIVIFETDQQMIDLITWYAPEHLIICTNNYGEMAARITNAGSVFLGNYTPESAGDYASGTNHTLPTNGWARSYSGVNMDSFVKKITFQEITVLGLRNVGPVVEIMAEAEHLDAHKNAIAIRMEHLINIGR